MPYLSTGRDPEFPRAAEQINVRGGGAWIAAADKRYRTSLDGFIEDNKPLLVMGLLGIAAFIMYQKELAPKKKRRNPSKRRNPCKRFKIVVYGGPGGAFTSYWGSRSSASKEHRDIKRMKFGRSKMFEKRGGRWVSA